MVIGHQPATRRVSSQLRQMQAVRASSLFPIRPKSPANLRPPWRSGESWPLRVAKTDSIHCLYLPMSRSGASRRDGRGVAMNNLFSTHPPGAERVRRLRELDTTHGPA